MSSRTNRALTDITDEGLFETLAASVLRLEPLYANLAHPGLNADGKTRKSPLDGICYTRDGKHIIATHHTVTAEKSLRAKWLQDPTTVKRRRNSKSQVETGDVVKAAKIFENERSRSSNLEATLVLTSNREIDPDLYSDVMAIARTGNFNVDIWSRTRIANVLDFDPRGQRIRRILGIEETDLSRELILEICAEIVNSFNAGDDRDLRNGRALDGQLDRTEAPVTLLVAGSGSGKTVACHQFLLRQILAGRPAIILPHEVLQQSLSLEQALFGLLKDKRPNLAN